MWELNDSDRWNQRHINIPDAEEPLKTSLSSLPKPSQCKQSWGQTFKSSLKHAKLDKQNKTKQRNEEFKGQVNLSLLPSLFLKGQFSFVD